MGLVASGIPTFYSVFDTIRYGSKLSIMPSELPKPLLHCPDLEQMRLLDELGLCGNVQNSIAVPVMSGAWEVVRKSIRDLQWCVRTSNKQLGMQVGGVSRRGVV